MKTEKLTGVSLDWAVAKCEGRSVVKDPFLFHQIPAFSADWSQGGPIIECENISIVRLEDESKTDKNGFWIHGRIPIYGAVIGEYFSEDQLRSSYGEALCDIYYVDCALVMKGTTPLIAAMRCYVASKLGDSVEIPKELTE